MYILHKNMKSGSGLSLSFEAPVANEDSTITLIAKIYSATLSFPLLSPVTSRELSPNRCYGLSPPNDSSEGDPHTELLFCQSNPIAFCHSPCHRNGHC